MKRYDVILAVVVFEFRGRGCTEAEGYEGTEGV
jgi:hypothetical protein